MPRTNRQIIKQQLSFAHGNLNTAIEHIDNVINRLGLWSNGTVVTVPFEDLIIDEDKTLDYSHLHEQCMEIITSIQLVREFLEHVSKEF